MLPAMSVLYLKHINTLGNVIFVAFYKSAK